MIYRELLNFKNQRIVDEVYTRYKNNQENEELDKDYEDITLANQTKKQLLYCQFQQVMDKVMQLLSLISMILFVILFVLGGSMILAFFGMWLHVYVFHGANPELFQWMSQLGMDIYDMLFASMAHLNSVEALKIEPTVIQMFYVLALTVIFIFIFIFIYTISMIRHKNKKKDIQNEVVEETNIKEESLEQLQKRIEKSYLSLRVDEDDSWKYIRSSFERNLKRRNIDFLDRYYCAYICLFDHHQNVEGSFHSLQQSQKIILCIRTFINSIKNILGTLSKPIFFSCVIVGVAYNIFDDRYINVLSLNHLLSGSMIGRMILFLIEKCYQIVVSTPLKVILDLLNLNIEVNKILATCLVISIIYIVYSLYKNKIRECQRQYQRRLNYYLKKNQGIYDENKKLSKNYLYSLDFTVFFTMLAILIIYIYLK